MSVRRAREPSRDPPATAAAAPEPTVTDSDLVLGCLDADFFLGGAMRIDAAAAERALAALAAELGLDAARGAFGVHEVVNENMAGAARVALAERGRAAQVTRCWRPAGPDRCMPGRSPAGSGCSAVVCPPGAGAGSTIGMLKAPARVDRVTSFDVELEAADLADAHAIFGRLESEALSVIDAAGAEVQRRSVRHLADMRYVGQGFEITVALPAELSVTAVREVFEPAYRGPVRPDPAGRDRSVRGAAAGPRCPDAGRRWARCGSGPTSAGEARKGRRRIHFRRMPAARWRPMSTIATRSFPGLRLRGPAIFEENESTFVVGPDSAIEILADGTIVVEMPTPPSNR